MNKTLALIGTASLALATCLGVGTALAQSAESDLRHVGRHVPLFSDEDIVKAKALEPVGGDFRAHLAREYQKLRRQEAASSESDEAAPPPSTREDEGERIGPRGGIVAERERRLRPARESGLDRRRHGSGQAAPMRMQQ